MKTSICLLTLAMLTIAGASAQQPSGAANSASPPSQQTAKPTPAPAIGNMEVLSDTQGVNFGPYLVEVLRRVRTNWYGLIPQEVRAPEMESGKVAIEFSIMPDGKIAGMKVVDPSGDVALDRAAWGAITSSNPFSALPVEFHGPFLRLRLRFYYNPKKSGITDNKQPGS